MGAPQCNLPEQNTDPADSQGLDNGLTFAVLHTLRLNRTQSKFSVISINR